VKAAIRLNKFPLPALREWTDRGTELQICSMRGETKAAVGCPPFRVSGVAVGEPRGRCFIDCCQRTERSQNEHPEGWTPNRLQHAGHCGRSVGHRRLERLRLIAWLALLFLLLTHPAFSATLTDPQVDKFNTRIGTQTFSGLYQFTTNNLLVETAQAILGMGSDNIKMFMGANYPGKYHTNLPASVTSLMTLAKNEPNCRAVLDMPFRRIIAWAYPLSNPDAPFQDGNYTATEAANDYREMYDLTHYLLTNYNSSGKTFYLGHWEGDGYLEVNNWTTNPPPAVPPAMVAWLNTRQKAIDDAKAATTFSNVNVFGYAEVNRVRDAMLNGPTNNVRAINYVIPYVTNLDYVSYSSYDAMNLSTANLYSTLDYIEAHVPTNKASVIPGERLWIGEYGWGGNSSDSQEPLNRAYIQRLLNYGSKTLPFILFWEIYDNEPNRNFSLIDSNNVKVASYYLHQRFINAARMFAGQFKETNGRLPNDSEFVSFISPLLNQPLPPPVPLTISNNSFSLSTNVSASVSGTAAQGVYGDDCAAISVFYGTTDGGTTRSAWQQTQFVGINTNFNPATFTALLTNLIPNTNYYFRFYATNSSGEVWAPSSAQFTTQLLSPGSFGSRMKITFAGYNRGEVLQNFPALVSLSPNLPGFSYAQFASPSGGDLRFADSDGVTPLLFEVDEWNTNGTSLVWVRVPQLSGPNDFIWAYWGDPSATSLPSSSSNGAVWSADHLAVWHLKESGFPYADSSQQHSAVSGFAPSVTTGYDGKGELFSGTSQFLNTGAIDLGAAFTLSAWVKLDTTATNIQTIIANKAGGWNSDGFALFINTYQTADQKVILETGNGTTGVTASTATSAVPFGQWHRVTASVDRLGGSARIFIDGVDASQASAVQTDMESQSGINLGRFTNGGTTYFKGVLDEVRIERGARSSNWIWASSLTALPASTFATYAPISRELPLLSVAPAPGGNLSLTWPSTGVGYTLYSATNLTPPVVWTARTNQAVLSGSNWQINLSSQPGGAAFYRLQSK
jgi:hypothetical protein